MHGFAHRPIFDLLVTAIRTGVKALNASLKDKWDRLRGMLVEPQA